jgi:hypothetical protein
MQKLHLHKPSMPTGTKLFDIFLVISAVVIVMAFHFS